MKKLNYLFLLVIITLINSCQSDNDSEIPNSAPNNFTITVSEIQSSKAEIDWTQATDVDGDNVTYSVELNNTIITQNLSVLSYSLEGLTNETNYTIKITAKDSNGAETISSKTFLTTSLPIPQDFTITVSDIDYTSAVLNWTESSTSENNTISYTVLLNDEIVEENIKTLSYEFTSLEHNTNFTGQVKAIADNGQVLIKDFEFKTLKNNAPETFELVYATNSNNFSSASFRFNAANDPENDVLEYRVILNNIDITETNYVSTYSAPTPGYNHSINNLEGNTTYELKIKAIDSFGNESLSNAISFTTNTTPPDNFNVEVYYVQGEIRLVWDRLTEFGYTVGSVNGEPVGSTFILDGVAYDLGLSLAYTYETQNTAQFNTDLISPNEEHELQIVLDWGTKKSYSNIVFVNNKIYSTTTVEVNKATIINSTSQYFPLQFTFTFKDLFISEYEDYEIIEINFHEKSFYNYIFIEQGAQNKGYLTGNINQEDFDYLSQFSDGYIETKDESGYHKIVFEYTSAN